MAESRDPEELIKKIKNEEEALGEGAYEIHEYSGNEEQRARDTLIKKEDRTVPRVVSNESSSYRSNVSGSVPRISGQELAAKLSALREIERYSAELVDMVTEMGRNIIGYDADEFSCRICMVGIGVGTQRSMTNEAIEALQEAELLIGAPYDLTLACDALERQFGANALTDKRTQALIRPKEIAECIRSDGAREISVIFSGDIGFYSAVSELVPLLEDFCYIKFIPGISVRSYFAAKLRLPYDDIPVIEFRDSKSPIIYKVSHNRNVFVILKEQDTIPKLCARLLDFGFRHVLITAGIDLGTSKEHIVKGHPLEFMRYKAEGLSVAVITNDNPLPERVTGSVADENFVQGVRPAYSQEVRSVILSKLRLMRDSIVYDIGANVGAVSVECAIAAPFGKVYSVEKNPENLQALRGNRRQFLAENMEIFLGIAPTVFERFSPPTHAFIRDAGGHLDRIIKALLLKNPDVRIVICLATLESLAEAMGLLKKLEHIESEMVSVRASRTNLKEGTHVLEPEREIYILTAQRRADAPAFSEREVSFI